jgi:N-acetylmuramoyl-L-alanine amidase
MMASTARYGTGERGASHVIDTDSGTRAAGWRSCTHRGPEITAAHSAETVTADSDTPGIAHCLRSLRRRRWQPVRRGGLAALSLAGALCLAVGCGAQTEVRATPVSPTVTLLPTLPAPTPPASPVATAPITAPATGSITGKIVVIDPGHAGGNAAHARDIATQVDIGNASKECDTVGAQAADGYTEHALNFDVAQRVRDQLSGAGAQVGERVCCSPLSSPSPRLSCWPRNPGGAGWADRRSP